MDEMRKNAAWAAKRLAEILDDLEEILLVAEGPSSKHDPEAMVHVYGSVQKAVTDIRNRVSKDLEDARKVFYNVSRGKRASLRISLIKAAYEMKPGEDRSELLALLLADFDPKEIGQTVPSPPGTHGGFTQKKFREQKELRDQGKLTFRRASDKPKKTDALKAMQGKKQTKELAEKAEQSGMSKRTFYDLIADALVFNSPWISDLAKYLNTKLKQKGAGSEFLEAVENSQYVRKELKQIHEDTWK